MDNNLLPFKKRLRFTNPEPMDIDPVPSTSGLNNIHADNGGDEDDDNDNTIFHNMRSKRARMDATANQCDRFVELESAFRGKIKSFFLRNNSTEIKDLCFLLSLHKNEIVNIIREQLGLYNNLKFNLMVECDYVKPMTGERLDCSFKTKNQHVYQDTDINSLLHVLFLKLCREETEMEMRGSGWALSKVDGFLLRLSKYQPFGGSTYIPLPNSIALKHAVINPQNSDDYCFKWAILCHFVKGVNRFRIDHRYVQLNDKLDFSGIEFPTPLRQVKKFEKNNCDISVNVYGLDVNNEIYPLKVAEEENKIHIDLLLITNDHGVSHYCYVSHLSRLISSQINKHSTKKVFCKRCLTWFDYSNKCMKLHQHKKLCKLNKPVRVLMPSKNLNDFPPILKFTNTQNMFKLPIVFYADFECILSPINEKMSRYTFVNNVHQPMSWCVYVVFSNDIPQFIKDVLPNEPYLYRGPDAAERFMRYVVDITNTIGDLININIPMSPLTDEENNRVKNARHCELCNLQFSSIYRPQRDHCHLTGKFRSVLCSRCNLKRQNQKNIPLFIHGSASYDTHFIVKQLGIDQKRVTVVPNTSEKYITFSKNTASGLNIRFVDTYKIMNCSLATLANNLPKNKFNHVSKFFKDEDMPLVTRKGVYPYEYTNSWDRLDEERLPPIESFFNSMTNSKITDQDYQHAISVWNYFNIRNLGEYSDLYLKLDVLLLSDVFENFRQLCLDSYELDAAHYLTLPSFTFDAMMKHTKIELDLITDYNMYLFIEKGIRGGITSCIKRHAVANNSHMEDDYDSNSPTSFLMYVDCNNLYGWAMSRPMPFTNFSWYAGSLDSFPICDIPDDSDTGYFLEVDIEYPESVHDSHSDFPFFPLNQCPPNSKQSKLLTTLENKTNYVCHYINLKQGIEHGLKLKKIHRILQFNQSCWLKPYIDLNTEKRQKATNKFDKDFYKLLNNAMFGKTIENIRKRINLELVTSENRLQKLINKPSFVDRHIYGESICAVECSKETIYFDKPIYIGFSVLELSKTNMYNFHYNIMKPRYGSNINILYIDTDCFFYEILTNDFYTDLKDDSVFMSYFDTSDYPVDHPCYRQANKKVLGKYKDECKGIVILEFIGLRPKLYSFKTKVPLEDESDDENPEPTVHKKAKGVTKGILKTKILFSDYKNCFLNDQTIRREMKSFRSKDHIVKTITVNKIALSANDDKRYINGDGVTTKPYGHYSLDFEQK